MDVGSSRSAAHVVSLVSGALKGLIIELGVVLEGRFWVRACCFIAIWSRSVQLPSMQPLTSALAQDELPEQMLATVRLEHLDLTTAAHLDAETGHITRKT